jgi:hypothetical protein
MLQLGKYLSYTVPQLSEFEAESCIRVVFTLFVFNKLNMNILWGSWGVGAELEDSHLDQLSPPPTPQNSK